jgi:phosphatidylserine/phosphatidylglycerophosphate/cardiolipin synthase-like enzyme
MSFPSSFIHEFLRRLESSSQSTSNKIHTPSWALGFPHFGFHDAAERAKLVTTSQPKSIQVGTGLSIFTESLIPAILSAKHEVILVTCFWAPSKTLDALHDALIELATRRRELIRDASASGANTIQPLNVRICLSSRSLLQKLFHTQSRHGYVYPPSTWSKRLGLPDPAVLEAGGIDLQVKSLFFLPFSVMHPKFVIIDRRRALVPSCNVSWESWLEVCVEVGGNAVQGLWSFYSRCWEDSHGISETMERGSDEAAEESELQHRPDATMSGAHHYSTFRFDNPIPTLILPSSSHRNPRFRPFPWQRAPRPPGTPLNLAMLQLFEQAEKSIYIQTPNITCQPVIAALLDALGRGVDVTIVTNRGMMLLEQLITAGTITSWCIRSLVRRFKILDKQKPRTQGQIDQTDVESGRRLGNLRVSYFHQWQKDKTLGMGRGADPEHLGEERQQPEEPVYSHLKLTLVDGMFAVLGSGNMDRASWYTSQELGVLFCSQEFCASIRFGLDAALEGRLQVVFDSRNTSRDGQ